MKDETTKRIVAEMREVARLAIARYVPDQMCESPRCTSGDTRHKATMATRIEAKPDLVKALAEHRRTKHTDGSTCWMDRVCTEGMLLCFCCVAQVTYKLLEVGLVPSRHYRMASVPVVNEKHAMSNTTRECGRQSRETIELVNEARKMVMSSGAEIRSMAIDKDQIEEIMKREGPEGVRRFITEQISKTIGDDIMAAMTEGQPLGDGEVGAPISESELKDIRRSLFDNDTLPTDISSMLGRQDN